MTMRDNKTPLRHDLAHLAELQQALVQLQADGIDVEAHNAPHDGCLYIIIPGVVLRDGKLEQEEMQP